MIRLRQVSKAYRINAGRASLRGALSSLPARLLGRNPSTLDRDTHWALRDVSFDVQRGEAVAIVGRNGAGKTTTLKLLSGITKPTTGSLAIEGRTSALIELGAGFHPDLSGRENIFLNGTILGLSRREIAERLDRIVAFAELERFIDTPVKRYSSGMYARLGFAVAAHTDPDVLLVDEVLAVGDNAFQQKCHDFIHRFVKSGKTTLFVSHNLYAAEQLCSRAVWLEGGRVRAMGPSGEVVARYLEDMDRQAMAACQKEDVEQGATLRIHAIEVRDADDRLRDTFQPGDDVVVDIEYEAVQPLHRPQFCLWITGHTSPDPLFAANMVIDGQAPERLDGRGRIRCVFSAVPLQPRVFYIWLEVWGEDGAEILFRWQRLASFQILAPSLLDDLESRPGLVRFTKEHAPVRVPYAWSFSPHSEHRPALAATLPLRVPLHADVTE